MRERPESRRTGKTRRIPPPDAAKRPGRSKIKKFPAWKLEDAKARFSELVRLARSKGPQRVTYRGEDAVVVVGVEEFERLLPATRRPTSLVEFLRRTALGEIAAERAPDRGRELAL